MKEKKGIMTICLHKKQKDEKDFGIVKIDKNNLILNFIEKSDISESNEPSLINSGIYIADPQIFDFIPKDKFFDFAFNLFPLLLKNNKKLFGYMPDCYWAELGNLDKYKKINEDLKNSKIL